MNQEQLQSIINSGLSMQKIANHFNIKITTVQYYMNKYNLKTLRAIELQNIQNIENHTYCKSCNKIKPNEEFYFNTKRNKISGYCRICENSRNKNSLRYTKQLCVDYKGGSCANCGYNKCLGALEFHHLDPSQKEFGISNYRSYTTLNDNIKKELDKCILLCANCHREEHFFNEK